MEFTYDRDIITLTKEENHLDRFVLAFTDILNKLNVKYAVISGYVAILFGRSRSSEDIDIFIEHLDEERFQQVWGRILKEFECLATMDPDEAYREYLNQGTAVRFSSKGEYVPNMEIKFPKTTLDSWVIDNAKTVLLNGAKVLISPLELQIAFKLFLGSGRRGRKTLI